MRESVCYQWYTFLMNSKEYFFNEVIKEAVEGSSNKSIKVLEIGCGTASYVPTMIDKYPNLEYVGIEPITNSFKKAEKNVGDVPRATVSSQLGYESIEGLEDASFDVVISFSVLEHVKQLGKFMEFSSRYVKKGGIMVHRYDLGHALYPWSLKERLHVFLGNTIPKVLPERKFVRYVSLSEVVDYYERFLGTSPDRYTYHQMRSHKALEKKLGDDVKIDPSRVMTGLYRWEFENAAVFAKLPLPVREQLFPTVAVWGRK